MNVFALPIVKRLASQSTKSTFGRRSSIPWSAYLTTCVPASKDTIDNIVKKNRVVVFMKGVPNAPQCGFSNAVIQILNKYDIPYETHNVLADQAIREGVKIYSDWPTIPQVFINGEFMGGCDIMLELHQTGKLAEALKKAGIKATTTTEKP